MSVDLTHDKSCSAAYGTSEAKTFLVYAFFSSGPYAPGIATHESQRKEVTSLHAVCDENIIISDAWAQQAHSNHSSKVTKTVPDAVCSPMCATVESDCEAA